MQHECKFYFDGVTEYKVMIQQNLKNMVKFCVPTWLVFAGPVTYIACIVIEQPYFDSTTNAYTYKFGLHATVYHSTVHKQEALLYNRITQRHTWLLI